MILPRKGTELGLFRASDRRRPSHTSGGRRLFHSDIGLPCGRGRSSDVMWGRDFRIFVDVDSITPRSALVRKIIPAAVALSLLAGPAAVSAQIALEVTGDLGYTVADAVDWLGNGIFNPNSLSYAGSAQVVIGRRRVERLGLQVGVEAGIHRLLTYDVSINGTPVRGDATALRVLGFTRFWPGGGNWFGEVGVGAFLFDGFTDPSLNVGVGTLLGSGRVQFPVKVRGSLLFDREALVFPVVFQTGVSFRIKN
jgi:hypothetical protein